MVTFKLQEGPNVSQEWVVARNLLDSFAVSVLRVRHELYNLLNSMCESGQVMAAAGMSKPITN